MVVQALAGLPNLDFCGLLVLYLDCILLQIRSLPMYDYIIVCNVRLWPQLGKVLFLLYLGFWFGCLGIRNCICGLSQHFFGSFFSFFF